MPGEPRILGAWIKRSLLSGPRPQTGPPSPPPIEQSQTEYIERFGPGGEAYGRKKVQQSLDIGDDSGDGGDGEKELELKKVSAIEGVYPCKLSNLPYTSDAAEVKTYADAALAAAFEEERALDNTLNPSAWTLVSTVVGEAPGIKFPDLSALRDRLRELSSSDVPRGTGLLLFASRAAAAATASKLDNQILGGRPLKASAGQSSGSCANKESWDGRYWSHGLSSKKRPRGGVQCYRCGQWGHMRDECTEQQQQLVPWSSSATPDGSIRSSGSGSNLGPACAICAHRHSDEDRRAMVATGRPWDHLCPGALNVHARVEQAAAITADENAMAQFAGLDNGDGAMKVLVEDGAREARDGRLKEEGERDGREALRCIVCAGAEHLFCCRQESGNSCDGSDTEGDTSTSSSSDSSDDAVSPDKAAEDGAEVEDEKDVRINAATTMPAVPIYCFHCGASGHSEEACLAEKAAAVQQMVQHAFQHPQGHAEHRAHCDHNYNSSGDNNYHDYNQVQHNNHHQNHYQQQQQQQQHHQHQQHQQQYHQQLQPLPPYASDRQWQPHQEQQQQQWEWQQQSHQQRMHSRYHSQALPRLDQEPWQPADLQRDREHRRYQEDEQQQQQQQQQKRKRNQRDSESASGSSSSRSASSTVRPPHQKVVSGKDTGRLLVLFDLNGTLIHRAPGYNGRSHADAPLPSSSSSSTEVVAPDHVHNSVLSTLLASIYLFTLCVSSPLLIRFLCHDQEVSASRARYARASALSTSSIYSSFYLLYNLAV